MSRDSVPEWSLIPGENMDIAGKSLSGNIMTPSDIPYVLQHMMAQLRAANDNSPTIGRMGQNRRRNRAPNPAFQLSTDTGNTIAAVHAARPADGWHSYHVGTGSTATIQRVQVRSLYGSTDQLECRTTTAKPVLAANDNMVISTALEGSAISDLAWGTAKAKPLIDTFELTAPAGTYSLHYTDFAGTRNYTAPFVVALADGGVPTRHTVVIPGDQTGAWSVGNGASIIRDLVLAAGAALQGIGGTWGGANTWAVAGQKNLLDNVANVVRLADVGLYADPDATGIAPAWEAPVWSEQEEWARRFYWKLTNDANLNEAICDGGFVSSTLWTGVLDLLTPMRAAPLLVVSNPADFQIVGAATFDTTALTIASAGPNKVRLQATVAGATAGQYGLLKFDGTAGRSLALQARLLG